MFSVIETGGKQYKVSVGEKIKVEKLEGGAGDKIIFDKVLLMADKNNEVQIGRPYLEKAKVTGEIAKQGRHKKLIVFRYKAKKREKKKGGHRQPFTEVKIIDIKV